MTSSTHTIGLSDESGDQQHDTQSEKATQMAEEIEELKQRWELRLQNASLAQPPAAPLPAAANLDTTVKRNSAFVKRVRTNLCCESVEEMCGELTQISLTKYLPEISSAIIDIAPRLALNAKDLRAASRLLTAMRVTRRGAFADFPTDTLLPELRKMKLDVPQMRLLADLVFCGVVPEDWPTPNSALLFATVLRLGKEDISSGEFINLPVIAGFARSAVGDLVPCTDKATRPS